MAYKQIAPSFFLPLVLCSRFSLGICFIHSSVYMSIPISQFILSLFPHFPCLNVHTFVLYVCVSVSALQISSSLPFCRFHMYALIYNVCFSDLLHPVWQLLGPSTFIQMAQFCFFWWLSNIPLLYVSHIIFIHASVDGLWACLHVLAIVNSPTVNIGVHVSFLNYDFSLSICPGVGFLGLMVMTKLYLMDWPKSLFAKSKYSPQK